MAAGLGWAITLTGLSWKWGWAELGQANTHWANAKVRWANPDWLAVLNKHT